MKKEKNDFVVKILGFLFLIPFYYITKNNNIFLYVLSYSLYLILISAFSNINIENVLKKYNDLKYYYVKEKLFKKTFLTIIIISLFLALLTSGVGYLLEYILNIKGIMIVYIAMSLTIFTKPCTHVIRDYLAAHNYKKLTNELENIYTLLSVSLLLIVSIFVFLIFNLNTNIAISLLYLSNILAFIATCLLVYFAVVRKNDKLKRKEKITREEYRISIKDEIKKIFSNNINESMIKMIKYSFIYLSIIFVYFSLTRKYRYSYEEVTSIINVTYFYGLQLLAFVCSIILYFNKSNVNLIVKEINTKNWSRASTLLRKDFNDLLMIILPITIFISILALPIWFLIFGTDSGVFNFMFLIYMTLFIVYYLLILEIMRHVNTKKDINIFMFIGLILKLTITLPLIDSFYRMGYNLIYGDILSNILVGLISIIVGVIFINKKIRLNFFVEFDSFLKVIYDNILLCLILILLNLIIPTTTTNRFAAFGIIITYLIMTIMFYIVKKRLSE